jgi:hypothetical protein
VDSVSLCGLFGWADDNDGAVLASAAVYASVLHFDFVRSVIGVDLPRRSAAGLRVRYLEWSCGVLFELVKE